MTSNVNWKTMIESAKTNHYWKGILNNYQNQLLSEIPAVDLMETFDYIQTERKELYCTIEKTSKNWIDLAIYEAKTKTYIISIAFSRTEEYENVNNDIDLILLDIDNWN